MPGLLPKMCGAWCEGSQFTLLPPPHDGLEHRGLHARGQVPHPHGIVPAAASGQQLPIRAEGDTEDSARVSLSRERRGDP